MFNPKTGKGSGILLIVLKTESNWIKGMVPIGPVFSGTSCRTFALITSEKMILFIYLFVFKYAL